MASTSRPPSAPIKIISSLFSLDDILKSPLSLCSLPNCVPPSDNLISPPSASRVISPAISNVKLPEVSLANIALVTLLSGAVTVCCAEPIYTR